MNALKTKINQKISTKELLKKGRKSNEVKRAKKIIIVQPNEKPTKKD